jgi:hypothetical protein
MCGSINGYYTFIYLYYVNTSPGGNKISAATPIQISPVPLINLFYEEIIKKNDYTRKYDL